MRFSFIILNKIAQHFYNSLETSQIKMIFNLTKKCINNVINGSLQPDDDVTKYLIEFWSKLAEIEYQNKNKNKCNNFILKELNNLLHFLI